MHFYIRQSRLLTVSFIISLINNKISWISSYILTFGWHTLQYDVWKYWRSVLTSALPPHHCHCSLCRYPACVDISRYLVQVFGRPETAISCGGLKLCPCWRPQLPTAATLATSTLVWQTRGLGSLQRSRHLYPRKGTLDHTHMCSCRFMLPL